MPATSKRQQRFMGIVHAIQKGDMPAGKAKGEARTVAKEMNPQDVTDFASTKRKGLPAQAKKACGPDNPFEMFRSVKSAVLTSSLRSAEKALRSAEAARRTALEETIAELKKKTDDMQAQVAQTTASAAENSALAQSLANPPPIPPAAQPQYGSMATVGPDGKPLVPGAGAGQSQAAASHASSMGAMPKIPGAPSQAA